MQRIRQRLVVTLPSYRNSWAKVHAGKNDSATALSRDITEITEKAHILF